MSAQKFGGAHSPGGGPGRSRLSGRKASAFSWRVLGLYFAPSALLLPGLEALFTADFPRLAWSMGPWMALIFAAWLTGQGLKAEAAYKARAIARPPAFPRKIVGAALTGLAVWVVGWFGLRYGPFVGAFYAAIAAGAHLATFGLDPMRAKGIEGVSNAEMERVAEKLDRAEAVVAETLAAAGRLKDKPLERRIDDLALAARDILKDIEGDPRDLRRARKFLGVHLVGLRDATVKFAAARQKGAAAPLRAAYEGLLGDLEQSFTRQRETLLIDDKVDLEVEIEVLRDRLKQEGAL